VTRTVAPHAATHFTPPFHLTGTQFLIMLGIAAVVAIVIIGQVLRRGD
jgi:hypothetical protein